MSLGYSSSVLGAGYADASDLLGELPIQIPLNTATVILFRIYARGVFLRPQITLSKRLNQSACCLKDVCHRLSQLVVLKSLSQIVLATLSVVATANYSFTWVV